MNSESRRYLILHETDLATLIDSVNIFMDAAHGKGWQPAGGPFSVEGTVRKLRDGVNQITGFSTITAHEETEVYWCQAIYRP